METQPQQNLSIGRNLKIAVFHLGSGMADVLATGIWNRIMISDLGFPATPIGLLASLRYFLAPLGIWAGRVSDQRTIGGYRRLFWIWLGRALMILSVFMLGITTSSLVRGEPATPLLWIVMTVAMLMFSFGTAISGSTYLALLYDRTGEQQRGRAVGLVWAFLLTGFAVAGFLFSKMLSGDQEAGAPLNPDTVLSLFIVAGIIFSALWFFSVFGEEQRSSGALRPREASVSLRADLKLVWNQRQTRLFFGYLALSMIFAFAQDVILEPFGGDVFGIDAAQTSRFAGYWGTMAILSILACLWLSRRYKRLTYTALSYIGVSVLVAAFVIFTLASVATIRPLVTVGLIVLGVGLGVWNVGTLGLMMDLSPAGRAGTFLGFWTMVEVIARGIGLTTGSVVRDQVLAMTGNLSLSYTMVFVLEVIGLVVALWFLSRVNVHAFKANSEQPADTATLLAGAMD